MGKKMTNKDIVKLILNSTGLILLVLVMMFVLPDDFGTIEKKNKDLVAAEDEAADNDQVLGKRTGKVRNKAARLASEDEAEVEPQATVMIYMVGSDLESDRSEATDDIAEMIDSGIGKNVNVLIQTMGTKKWNRFGIASDHTQLYTVKDGKLNLVEDSLKQLDSTAPDTLANFIRFGRDKYKTGRYMLILWGHGQGPVYGFGYDEWKREEDTLTLDEIRLALEDNKDIRFDLIGMDSCIMAGVETAAALSGYCDRAVLSEDFVSRIGWEYGEWMAALEKDPKMDTDKLGELIINSTIKGNEAHEDGRSTTMVMVDEDKAPGLFDAWKAYAYANEGALFAQGRLTGSAASVPGRRATWKKVGSTASMADYYIEDLVSLMKAVDDSSEAAIALNKALAAAQKQVGQTSEGNGLNGMSVTVPCGDDEKFFGKLDKVYTRCGFDEGYVSWVGSHKGLAVSGNDAGISNDTPLPDQNQDTESRRDTTGDTADTSGTASESGAADDAVRERNGVPKKGELEYIKGDWKYDKSENVWYTEVGDIMYLYDESDKNLYYYDKKDGSIYCYDEELEGEWDWYE
ncbi:MAG: hypothetical protein K5857_03940 [Lachnospiraceae bacterium]|nr:hypothetical protein [Lachnospiraceae bacterium]